MLGNYKQELRLRQNNDSDDNDAMRSSVNFLFKAIPLNALRTITKAISKIKHLFLANFTYFVLFSKAAKGALNFLPIDGFIIQNLQDT